MLEGRAGTQRDQEPTRVLQGQMQSVAPGREEPFYHPWLGPTAEKNLWVLDKPVVLYTLGHLGPTMVYSVYSLPLEYLTLKP